MVSWPGRLPTGSGFSTDCKSRDHREQRQRPSPPTAAIRPASTPYSFAASDPTAITTVTNTGNITTFGHRSDGIEAGAAVFGGLGNAAVASTTVSNSAAIDDVRSSFAWHLRLRHCDLSDQLGQDSDRCGQQ